MIWTFCEDHKRLRRKSPFIIVDRAARRLKLFEVQAPVESRDDTIERTLKVTERTNLAFFRHTVKDSSDRGLSWGP